MSPIDLARSLARGDDDDRVLAVAIVTRGLTDDDPATGRVGWPLSLATTERAAQYLDLAPTGRLILRALTLAPTLSDAILNRSR